MDICCVSSACCLCVDGHIATSRRAAEGPVALPPRPGPGLRWRLDLACSWCVACDVTATALSGAGLDSASRGSKALRRREVSGSHPEVTAL